MRELICILALFLMAVGTLPAQETQTFPAPSVDGRRVDICLEWGAQCGQPAADAFCQEQGFDAALAWEPDEDIGAVTPTVVLAGRAVCDDPSCDGFATITCVSAAPPTTPLPEVSGTNVFEYPQSGGVAIDWCLAWGAECGQPAADRFCRDHGFPAAVRFEIAEDVAHTVIQSTGQPCDDPGCDGFASIECGGTPAPVAVSTRQQREILVFDPAAGRATYFDLAPNGALASKHDIGVQWESSSIFPVARDFNGDGGRDLLRWIPERTTLEMVRFDAAGQLVQSEFAYNLLWKEPEVAPGDFNGDGHADVAALEADSSVVRTLQFGSDGVLSVFNEIHDFPHRVLGYAHDLNADGRDELLVEFLDGTVHGVSFNDSLSDYSTWEMGSAGVDTHFSLGDFDGDGLQEIIALNNGTGAMEMIDLGTDLFFGGRHPLPSRLPHTVLWRYARDWNGDGRDELALSEPAGETRNETLLFFDQTGNVSRSVTVAEDILGVPFVGEFTNTGPMSLLVKEPGGTLRLVTFDADLNVQSRFVLAENLSADARFLPSDYDGD